MLFIEIETADTKPAPEINKLFLIFIQLPSLSPLFIGSVESLLE